MAPRKQFPSDPAVSPELSHLLTNARFREVPEEDLREQRISFAYGNALGVRRITKESVRAAASRIRLQPLL